MIVPFAVLVIVFAPAAIAPEADTTIVPLVFRIAPEAVRVFAPVIRIVGASASPLRVMVDPKVTGPAKVMVSSVAAGTPKATAGE